MAETLISPGVLARENDSSFIRQQPVNVGAAIIGPTVLGPVEIPTVVTSYSDYVNRFGAGFQSGSDNVSFFTSIAAYNYFNNGGTSLLVARVVSASNTWAPATNTNIYNNVESGVLNTNANLNNISTNSTASVSGTTGSLATGSYIYSGTTGIGAVFSITKTSGSVVTNIAATTGGTGYNIGDTFTFQSASIGTDGNVIATLTAADIVNGTAFVLTTLSEGIIMNSSSSIDASGSLASGSSDNIRWQISNADTASGTFSLLIRQGNDNTNNPIVLETWTGLSLDPFASNYIAKVLGDQDQNYNVTNNQIEVSGSYFNASRYVRVSAVNSPTPYYFTNTGVAKNQYTSSIPQNASGSFTNGNGTVAGGAHFYETINASNTQGLVGTDYDNMIDLLSNQDEYKFNILFAP